MTQNTLWMVGALLASSSSVLAAEEGGGPSSKAVSSAETSATSSVASTHGAPTVQDAIDARCSYLRAVAGARSALLVAPRLTGSGSLVRGVTSRSESGEAQVDPAVRLRAGALYSLGDLRQGLALRSQAEAECEAYRATTGLLGFTERYRAGLFAPALEHRKALLTEALPRAESILASTKKRASEGLVIGLGSSESPDSSDNQQLTNR